jgi:hypothetical protein
MERYDDRDELDELDELDAVDEAVEDKHPAQAQEGAGDSGFAEGLDHKPDAPEEDLEPDYARGLRTGPEAELEHRGRFSEGIEEDPGDPENEIERRFSEGIERNPTSE